MIYNQNDKNNMEVTIVRFNRPLLIRMDNGKREPFFQTVYGFVIEGDFQVDHHQRLDDYVGYLAGMHEVSNGSDWFSISYELRGVPDWVDKKGKVHPKQDNWISSIQEKCRKKLNLSYTLIHWDMDEEDYYDYLNEQNLIVDDTFFYNLEMYQPYEKGPFYEVIPDDGLPF